MAEELQGKVAIVTGGNTGIGAAVVAGPRRAGGQGRHRLRGQPGQADRGAGAQARRLGETAVGVEADVSKVDDLQRMIDTAVSNFGRLDIMVNNAGIETRTSVLDTTEGQFEKVMAVNLKSAFFGTQLAAKQMIAQGGGGRIINMTSVHEDWPMPGNTAYCLSKGGMRMLTRTAGVELAPHNICVVGVGPGAVNTPINAQTVNDPAALAKLNSRHPDRPPGRARGDRLGRRLPGRRRRQLRHRHDDLRRRRHHAEQPRALSDPGPPPRSGGPGPTIAGGPTCRGRACVCELRPPWAPRAAFRRCGSPRPGRRARPGRRSTATTVITFSE